MRRRKVALLDNDPDLLSSLAALLRAKGFETVEANLMAFVTGKRDLGEFLEAEDPWIVVYDLPYPYREHWDFFRRAREAGVFGDRCVVLTSTNPVEAAKYAGGERIHPLLTKPFDLDQLLKTIEGSCA